LFRTAFDWNCPHVRPAVQFRVPRPEGDTAERMVCGDCGHISYDNPKIVVGSVVSTGERILLCRRAIAPRKGFWTLPAGYLEQHETPEDGARREARVGSSEARTNAASCWIVCLRSIQSRGRARCN
jgi:hypothetical protein